MNAKSGPALGLLAVAIWLLVLATWTYPGAAHHQQETPLIPADKVYIPGVVRELAGRVADAERLAAKKRWQDCADAFLALIREHGDDLVPVAGASEPLASGQRFVQARWLAHQRIAQLPPQVWAAYRKRMDGVAKKWLDEAIAVRDVRQLRRIVDDAFLSQPAMQALELLGEMAFERGDFAEAQHWWRLLATPLSADAGAELLAYPDAPAAVLARVRAKQIVTLLFQEQADALPAELATYRKVHGSATGALAGRKGKYADIIEALAKQKPGSLPAAEQEWPTFGGDPSRNRALPLPLSPNLWADGPAWRVRLDNGERIVDSEILKVNKPKTPASQLACHPIICGGVAYTADARYIRGFELRSGKLVWQFDLQAGRKVAGADELRFLVPPPPDLRYTLTAADGYLCARMGTPWFGPLRDGEKRIGQSWLVCLKIPTSPAASPTVSWAEPATGKPGDQIAFEGTPLIHHKAVYVAQSRVKGNRTATAICCFDAQTTLLRWEQEVCEGPEFPEGSPPRCRNHLLTLAGTNIVYCSNAGAVVALDAATGNRTWAVRYANRGLKTRDGQPSPRDVCPPIAACHRIVIAPADIDRLFCFDAATGQSLWERDGIEIVHLVGVSHHRVVFTTTKGLGAVHVATGANDGGWRQPLLGNLASLGRPFIVDAWVFWPTVDTKLPWRAVNLLDGKLVRGPESYDAGLLRPLVAGNAALGHGCLVIATGEELLGYVPPQPPLGPPRT